MVNPILTTKRPPFFLRRCLNLYVDGFRNMSRTSRILWIIILLKLVIMFGVLRLFFFPNVIKSVGKDKEKQVDFVVEELTRNEYKSGEIPLWYDKHPSEDKDTNNSGTKR